jgi:hypothetical protein
MRVLRRRLECCQVNHIYESEYADQVAIGKDNRSPREILSWARRRRTISGSDPCSLPAQSHMPSPALVCVIAESISSHWLISGHNDIYAIAAS